ncbi:Ig-like domain-containing protein [Vibrio aestuarianus]|uniref:Ig-like domain-containing protein n=1 Tax=Vibrio aestuarianus TaxID=28171 RepID=UPI00237D3007|nr:Ig-like domain-containing protein [Vibrio aestuarianus]MDE1336242.1 Ig-like domain-containing protein [Vibrio aestuarianus]
MMNVKSILVCVLLLIHSVILTGCKNGDSDLLSGESTVTALQLTPSSVTLAVNTTQEYLVTAYYADGTTKNVTDQVTWSFDSEIVSLQNNVATALKNGQTDITATLGNVTSNNAVLTVSSAQILSLSVFVVVPEPIRAQSNVSSKGGMLTLALGNKQGFKAVGNYDDGHSQDLTQHVNWNSMTDAGRFISQGTLLGEQPGLTSVTATLDTKQSGPIFVGVRNAQLLSIEIRPNEASIPLGNQQQYKAVGTYSDDSRRDISQDVVWKIEDGKIASFDKYTLSATGLAEGKTSVTAKLNGVSSLPASLTVTKAALESLYVSPENSSIAKGSSQIFQAIGLYSDGSEHNVSRAAQWQSSDVDGLQIVDGISYAAKVGQYELTASYQGVEGYATVEVVEAELESINILPDEAYIPVGSEKRYKAFGVYSDGTKKDISRSALWEIVNKKVASFDQDTLFVTGISEGSTSIKAELDGVSATAVITVTPAILESLYVSPENPSITQGNSLIFQAVGVYSDGSEHNVSRAAQWQSSDVEGLQIVDGISYAAKVGQHQLTASSQGVEGHATVMVEEAELVELTLNPSEITIDLGGSGTTITYTLDGHFNNGTTAIIDNRLALWVSSDDVGLSITDDGVATAESVGEYTITAEYNNLKTRSIVKVK